MTQEAVEKCEAQVAKVKKWNISTTLGVQKIQNIQAENVLAQMFDTFQVYEKLTKIKEKSHKLKNSSAHQKDAPKCCRFKLKYQKDAAKYLQNSKISKHTH